MAEIPHLHIVPNAHATLGVRLFSLGARRELRVTVVAKLALDLTKPAAAVVTPPAIVCEDEPERDGPLGAVSAVDDLAPRKPRCDVTLVGRARTPGEHPADALPVRLAVYRGNAPLVQKAIVALAPRTDGVPTVLTHAPIGWSRALGGEGFPSNPIGSRAPSVFLLDAHGRPSTTEPGGLGPLPLGWAPRRERLDEATRRGLASVVPEIPDNVDWTGFLSAPRDQQAPYLSGGEWLLVDGVSRTLPRVQTQLPTLRARALVVSGSAHGVESVTGFALSWDTLAIDTERMVAHVVLRGDVAAPPPLSGAHSLAQRCETLGVLLKFGAANDEIPAKEEIFSASHRTPVLAKGLRDLRETRGLTGDDHASAARAAKTPFVRSVTADPATAGPATAESAIADSGRASRPHVEPPWRSAASGPAPMPVSGRTPITADLVAAKVEAPVAPPLGAAAAPRETFGQKLAMRAVREAAPSAQLDPTSGRASAPAASAGPAPRPRPSASKTELAERALRKSGMSEARIADVLRDIARGG